MAVQIFKPNIEAIRALAAQARKEEENRKSNSNFKDGDIVWGSLIEGVNQFRILPSTNSRGIIGKRVGTHYFSRTKLANAVPRPVKCLTSTHADMPGITCPIHDAGDKLLAQYPQLNLGGWLQEGVYWYIQAYDRNDIEHPNTCKIYKLTPAIYNWLIIQMEQMLIEGVDITDPQAGIDVQVIKRIERYQKDGKSHEMTKYEKSLWSPKGPTPVHDDPNVVNAILESMKDLDTIWPYPKDEKLLEINSTAATITNFYTSMMAQQATMPGVAPGVQTTIPGTQPTAVATPPPATTVTPVQPQPAVQTPPVAAVAAPQAVAATPPVQPQAPQPQTVVAPPATPQPVATPTAPVPPAGAQPSPTDKPACFAGQAPRSDGGSGYSEQFEDCLMCRYELQCMDASKGA